MQSAGLGPSGVPHGLPAFPERWIPAFRYLVLVLAFVHLVLFVVAVPIDYQNQLEEIPDSYIDPMLKDAGISHEFFAGYNAGIVVFSGLVFIALGLLIFWRRRDSFMPLFVSLVLIVEGTQLTGLFYALDSIGMAGVLIADTTDAFSSTLLAVFFFIFPTGRFVPGWTRWVALGILAVSVLTIVLRIRDPLVDFPVFALIFVLFYFGVMIYSQIHRYRWVCTPVERQQMKWVIVGMIAAIACFSVAVVATVINPDRGPFAIFLWVGIANLGLMMIPISIAIAILRHQLLDIDRLINRTLVYAIVTAVLGLTYAGSVILLQLLSGFIAGSSGLAVALSTLFAVAMFKPLRDGVQRTVDRRFFRTRYDAADLLSRFSQTIRDEVDLNNVQRAMTRAIDEAVRPSRMSVWLPEPQTAHVRQRVLGRQESGTDENSR